MKKAIFFLLIILSACGTQGLNDEPSVKAENKFSDEEQRIIYNHQDRRETASLIAYLSNENAEYREQACLALASVQDSTALGSLTSRLKDSTTDVRLAAAYAIGQLKSEMAADSLLFALAWEQTPIVRKVLLEALGKCSGKEQMIDFLNYEPLDSLSKAGFAWGLYRAGVRGLATPVMVAAAVSYLYDNESPAARLGAAHFLGRSREVELTLYQDSVLAVALNDQSPDVRMALASALRHTDEEFALDAIEQILIRESDYRVKINCVRALSEFNNEKSVEIVTPLLQASNPNLAQAAADFLAPKLDGDELLVKANATKFWRARATLLGGALSKGNLDATKYCVDLLAKTTNPYEKATVLTALSNDVSSLQFLVDEAFKTDNNAIRTASMQGILKIRDEATLSDEQKVDFGETFKKAVEQGDMAMVVLGASGLRNDEWNYTKQFTDFQFLYDAKEKLSLPKDNEILQSLQATIDYFEGADTATPVENEFNHPIDWAFVAGIDAEQLVTISTAKGDIVVRMLVNDSPGSVANFMALADSGYYDHSVFHRIVPNFVAQGGDPRGDGWGGEDYSIRSEIGPLRYQSGSVGMASAGKDTEGVQWFITHSPTPHLDGAYSIFAVVNSGMDVVHQLELGDEIISIKRVQ
jgi:cyclophilin family peptidyl-prolyl cis-trans isomerase/HEAT repeat protein